MTKTEWNEVLECLIGVIEYNNNDDPTNGPLQTLIDAIKEERVRIITKRASVAEINAVFTSGRK